MLGSWTGWSAAACLTVVVPLRSLVRGAGLVHACRQAYGSAQLAIKDSRDPFPEMVDPPGFNAGAVELELVSRAIDPVIREEFERDGDKSERFEG